MRIDFQLSLNEWIEWKRANLSRNRFTALRIAEGSVIPLAILTALTFILVWLRYVPGWLPIVILGLIGLGQIFLSTVPGFRKRALKKEWLGAFANQRFTVELNENGFDYSSATVSYKPTWNEVASVYQTKHLLMFCDDDTYVLLIPKRAFASKAQLDEFIELAYQRTVSERHAVHGNS
jgi:YcxB-like protein